MKNIRRVLMDLWRDIFGADVATGLVINQDLAKYVRLRRKGKHLNIVEQGTVEATECGRELFNGKSSHAVIATVDGPQVRCVVVEVPNLKDNEILPWLRTKQDQVFPPSVSMDNFIHDIQVLKRDAEKATVLFCSVYPERVEETTNQISNYGGVVEMLGARGTDLYNPFALWQPDFLEGNKAIVQIDQTTAGIVIVEAGLIAFEREVDISDEDHLPGRDWTEVERTLVDFWEKEERKGTLDKIHAIGTDEDIDALIRYCTRITCPIESAKLVVNGNTIAPEYIHALGLALKKFHALLNSINLLPAPYKERITQQHEKQRALGWLVKGTCLLALLLALAGGVRYGIGIWLNRLESDLQINEQQIAEMEKIQANNKRLEKETRELKFLVRQRTRQAKVLESLNQVVPDSLWLNRLDMTHDRKNGRTLICEGFALTSDRISTFLHNLETSDQFNGIQLLYTEKLSNNQVLRLSDNRSGRVLFKFKLTCRTSKK
jgi:Tfp pilus assembly protein PilN